LPIVPGRRACAMVPLLIACFLTACGQITPKQVAVVTTSPRAGQPPVLLPGEQILNNGVSSYLFGSNDTEEWSADNVETDPHHVIQPAMLDAHMQLERTFVFHYSLRDGHRTSIGPEGDAAGSLHPANAHEYDQPAPSAGLYTGAGYEVETRIDTIERMGMHCLVVFPDIRTTPSDNTDPNPGHHRIIDPDTGQPETDLAFAEKVVAYLGNRCNLYEIGNEPDLNTYTSSGAVVPHLPVTVYVARWTAFVTALRAINPNAKFIGPVTYNDQGNDCSWAAGTPYPTSRSGDCYMQNFLHGVAGGNVQPDAVSFHWYPCSNATDGFDSGGNCGPAQAASYATVTDEVRGWVQADLGHSVPIGITEWNADPGPGSGSVLGNAGFMAQFTQASLQAMISAKLDFAAQFDTQSNSGWCYLDMFDSCHGTDRPKAQFTVLAATLGHYQLKGPIHLAPSIHRVAK